MELGLAGKAALVTGSSRGIGRGIALALADAGCDVLVTGRDVGALEDVAAAARRKGVKAAVVPLDLCDAGAAGTLIETARRTFGGLDILVNNAGATKRGDFFALDDGDWQDGFALKFFAHVRLARAAWPSLKERRGSLITIGGTSGRKPHASFAIGSSVNAACAAFSKALADMGKQDGVQVNCIHPSLVDTDRQGRRIEAEMKRSGLPEAVIDAKYPDWSGQWSRVPDGGPPRYDTTKPLRAQQAPMKPQYRVLHEASMADQDAGGLGLDLACRCIPQGMPRQMSGVSPMEFLISPTVTHVLFEVMSIATRRIYTDGRDWPKDLEPTFGGYSIGKWIDAQGSGRYDTLAVETRFLRGPRTWDQSGMPTADDADGVIKERLYLDQANPNILHDEMTTIDNSLTRPWSAMKSYRRAQNVIWAEDSCSEGNPHIFIGKEVYFRGPDGLLMPVKKDQPPPDLRYFNQSRK